MARSRAERASDRLASYLRSYGTCWQLLTRVLAIITASRYRAVLCVTSAGWHGFCLLMPVMRTWTTRPCPGALRLPLRSLAMHASLRVARAMLWVC